MFRWLSRFFPLSGLAPNPPSTIARRQDNETEDCLLYNTNHPGFDDDGTLHIRTAIVMPDQHIDGICDIRPNDPEYGFWCWLLAQEKHARLLGESEISRAKATYQRMIAMPPADNGQNGLSNADMEAVSAKVVRAFAEVMEDSLDKVLDVHRLPFEKDVIREAFARRIAFYERCSSEEPENQEWKDALERHRAMKLRVADFQEIDQSDKTAVRDANAGRLDDRKTLLLVMKYHERAMKEDGIAIDEPLEHDGETVSFEELCRRFLS